MSTQRSASPRSNRLRAEAEAKLAHAPRKEEPASSADALLHELQVQQIELEMQNETLRQTQAALEESRDRYMDLYEFAPVSYLTLSNSGLITDINLTAAAMLGENRNKLLNRSFAQFVVARDQDKWQGNFVHALRHGATQTFELSLQRADGTAFEASLDSRPITSSQAVPTLRMTLRDNTEHKQLAETLRQREHYLQALLDNFPFLVWFKDEKSRFIAVNRPYADSCGQSSCDQIMGKTDLDFWPRELAEHYRADDQEILTSGVSRIIEEPLEINGSRSWHETYKAPVVIDGRVIGTVGFARDISAHRQSMANLRSSEERLRLAKTASNLGIFDHHIPSGEITWDERLREIWGVEPDEPISYTTFMDGLHPDDRAATQVVIDKARDPNGTGEYYAEYRVINRKDGKVWHVGINGQVFFHEGHAVRLVGTVKDITAQKILESAEQEHRSEMELLIKQQVAAQTAAAIAHELNQPLSSISVYTEVALRMLRSGSNTQSPEKLEHALESAMEQAQRAGRTLHELLDFLHKGETALEPADLNMVILEALTIAREGGYGGFRPVLALENDLPPVLTNRLQLQKVLVNLLHNGVEAMRSAGLQKKTLTITTQIMAANNMVKVTIQDSGPGLDAETAQRIFEPFFTTKSAGIGLGLAISRALIEAHGGQLWADSVNGTGATFHFTLPIAS